jgi:hypothetical protein
LWRHDAGHSTPLARRFSARHLYGRLQTPIVLGQGAGLFIGIEREIDERHADRQARRGSRSDEPSFNRRNCGRGIASPRREHLSLSELIRGALRSEIEAARIRTRRNER